MSEDPTKYQTEAEAETLALTKVEPDNQMAVELAEAKIQLTPQQARVDAVAHVLAKAYDKASTLTLTPEETKALKADFPMEAFQKGAGGNPDLIYIEHAHLRDRFDTVLGMGQWALVRSRPHWAENFRTMKGQEAVRIYADCALLIRGCLVSEAIGEMCYFPNNATQSYGDAVEGSETAAFRRCAKKIGVGLQAWKKEFCAEWIRWNAGRNLPQRPVSAPAQGQVPASTPRSSSPAPAPKPEKKLAPGEELREWLQRCKEKFLKQASACLLPAWEYAIQEGWILETERLDAVSLSKLFPGIDWGGTVESNTPIVKAVVEQAWAGIQKIADSPENPEMKKKCLLAYAEKETEPDDNPACDVVHGDGGTEDPVTSDYSKITGQIVAVTTKSGTGKKGPWTLYGIKIADIWANTFDKKLGLLAQQCKGQQVTLTYEEDAKGFKVVNIEAL